MKKINDKLLVGSLEECGLPGLNIDAVDMRVDTGAQTSSIHVDNIEEFEKDNELWVRFDIHPDIHNVDTIVQREAKVKAQRHIKSSNATRQKRYVIDTKIQLGDATWAIELTLTDRSAMSYLMLLGRQAMEGRLIVDPEQEYLLKED
ncbi:ATP-dependent zinc protease family protein [Alkalimarinus alittae]|uniref:ATP-dependent zinc protease n=1 Tax=Alkalimarinus alittae TaxID=2961619 RepID=A0ABY6MZW5_9ALTE|nr:ATP-dependent zinc protease [Alkalimarinus alittae]UZE95393.1 ATP-dependent zinc protease [Alkalimarinus alittae]